MEGNSIQLQSQFIEQEHRFIRVLTNFFVETRGLPSSDPRRKAASKALIWQFVPSGGNTTFALGGLLALATVYFSAQQYSQLVDQNALLQKQELANESKYFWERRAQLLSYLYDSEASSPKYNERIRSEAVAEFLQLEGIKAERNYLNLVRNEKLQSRVATLSYGIDLNRAILASISLNHVAFRDASLAYANFRGASLFNCDFTGAALDHADLENADLTSTNLAAKSLLGVNLTNANLSVITGWGGNMVISLANIHGIKNAPNGFREWALNRGAVDEPDTEAWLKFKKKRLGGPLGQIHPS